MPPSETDLSSAPHATFPFDKEFAWVPDEQTISDSNLMAFMKAHDITSYDRLYAKSIDDVALYWDGVMKQLNI